MINKERYIKMTNEEIKMMEEIAKEYNEWLKELEYEHYERMDDEWR